MIVHNIDPVFLDFGLFQIKWYSLSYIFGIIFGWMYAIKIINNLNKANIKIKIVQKKEFDDLVIYIILGVIIGGRLGYVLFYNPDYYVKNFLEIFQIWKGGMSFHGGLIGVIIFTIIFSQKNKIKFFLLSDIISCVAPIGIFLGRIANFINGELYGKISNLPWAIIFPQADNFARHPSQIYEAILEGLILFILINFLAFKKNLILKTGYISGIFLIFYSVLRIFGEIFREADQHLGYFLNYLSMGTLLSIATLLCGIIIILMAKKNEQSN
tara:strand:- start:815 stop:1624 length:810 start_codon:yes stop_codon:yes gene_type:complete